MPPRAHTVVLSIYDARGQRPPHARMHPPHGHCHARSFLQNRHRDAAFILFFFRLEISLLLFDHFCRSSNVYLSMSIVCRFECNVLIHTHERIRNVIAMLVAYRRIIVECDIRSRFFFGMRCTMYINKGISYLPTCPY